MHVSEVSRAGGDRLSRALRRSTIGPGGLNDRVRNGIGWGTPGKTTSSTNRRQGPPARRGGPYLPNAWKAGCAHCEDIVLQDRRSSEVCGGVTAGAANNFVVRLVDQMPPGVARGWMRRIKPVERLVPVSFMGRPTSTPGLSTWWSTTALGEVLFRGGFPA